MQGLNFVTQSAWSIAHSVGNSESSDGSNALPYALCALLLNRRSLCLSCTKCIYDLYSRKCVADIVHPDDVGAV